MSLSLFEVGVYGTTQGSTGPSKPRCNGIGALEKDPGGYQTQQFPNFNSILESYPRSDLWKSGCNTDAAAMAGALVD